ncbi:hypothetical protein HCN44_006465 [Aphidius gifuensis]|uniref:Uncharacterized protein n=1 Tax=Aphidius gifuensis TaxID=684658 RepID=A0A835CVG6_APHGI|nr:uncharacterized protein LOC122850269 isoform X2 [Aphidius gifuensis]KAF7995358.1 hypothetical protein HCN44_006465 [Aphidius gifuensis]
MDDKITADSTVRSLESNVSSDTSKNSIKTGDSKTDSCKDSKYSKDILINKSCEKISINYLTDNENNTKNNKINNNTNLNDKNKLSNNINNNGSNDTNIMMITSCGQLIFGLVLITFGILVLIHGVSLGTSGAGLWAGMSALVAGSLGLVAALAESTSKTSSSTGFSTAHLATTLVALGLANLSTIAAINSIVRDARSSESDLYISSTDGDGKYEQESTSWPGLLASIGLLVSSLLELFVAGYTCIKLSPKLCSCLVKQSFEPNSQLEITDVDGDIGKLKTKNMVHQWVIAQTHSPKNSTPPSPSTRQQQQPFYIVHQPLVTLQPLVQTPYGAVPYSKYPPGAYHLPAYGPIPMIPQVMPPLGRVPSMQMYRPRQKKYAIDHHHHHQHQQQQQQHRGDDDSMERKKNNRETKTEPKRMMLPIGEDDNNTRDFSLTYTGLDKKMSEEFISICMDPERKSRTSSNYGSEIDSSNAKKS